MSRFGVGFLGVSLYIFDSRLSIQAAPLLTLFSMEKSLKQSTLVRLCPRPCYRYIFQVTRRNFGDRQFLIRENCFRVSRNSRSQTIDVLNHVDKEKTNTKRTLTSRRADRILLFSTRQRKF